MCGKTFNNVLANARSAPPGRKAPAGRPFQNLFHIHFYTFSHFKRPFYKEIKHLPFTIVLMLYFFDNSLFLFMKQSKHKFILNIDGNVAAFRLLSWMQTGSVIMNVKSDYSLWFSDKLKHRKNIVEIKADLSDLEKQYEWCLQNDDKCKQIAKEGMLLSKKLLTKDNVMNFIKMEFL